MELKLPDIVDSLFKLSKRLGESLVLGTVGLSVAMAELVMHLALGEPLGGWLFAGIAIAVIGYGCAALFAARKRRYESEAGMTFEEAVAKVRDLDGRVEEVEGQLSRYAMDDEADAAKLGATVEQVRSLAPAARAILHGMTQGDADAFRELCARCFGNLRKGSVNPFPLFVLPGERYEVDVAKRARLSDLRLGDFNPLIVPYPSQAGKTVVLDVGGSKLLVAFPKGGKPLFPVLRFTDEGRELASLCELGTAEGFGDAVVDFFGEMGCDMKIVTDDVLNDELVKGVLGI